MVTASPKFSRQLTFSLASLASLTAGCDLHDEDAHLRGGALEAIDDVYVLDDAGDDAETSADTGDDPISQEAPCGASSTLPPATQCETGRQIAQVSGDCPVPDPGSPWTVERMFDGLDVQGSLPRYCRYLWQGGPNTDPNPGLLPAAVEPLVSPDCKVFPQGPLDDGLGPRLDLAFAQGVDMVSGTDDIIGRPGAPVQISVVDTAPAQASDGRSAHGPAIAAIIANVANGCVPALSKGQQCRRGVETFLGLPQIEGVGRDEARGGYFGYQSELAEGIAAAVDAWENTDHKLIINLSVGWEPSLGDLDDSGQTDHQAVMAVRDAIGFAGCRGALVVAASGNLPPGSCVSGGISPGAWEALPGFDAGACLSVGVANPAPQTSQLLYAATPLDWSLDNLQDLRPGSDARIATVGFGGVGSVYGVRRGPLTGSSVSAATLSGVAALLWSYYPAQSVDELMTKIYDSGVPRVLDGSPIMATLHGPQSPYQQHLVTACEALAYTCDALDSDPGRCASLRSQCSGANVDRQSWWQDYDSALAQLDPDAQTGAWAPAMVPYECQACDTTPRDTKLPAHAAIDAGDMPDPWSIPQPEDPPCPMCGIQDDEGYLALDQAYRDMSLQNVSITLDDGAGGEEVLIYGALALDADSVYTLVDSDLMQIDRSNLPPVSARVDMVFTDATGRTFTAGNQIPVN
ncbi:S8 family serine peptidase [Pseudenhygromyxa sp. WMMC2535]|uniref:S8/S53 family peptidase n=1 Tax=Pseudenhygromyxa sp. WMMC2535 TaxID=2712867 RepID=UPI0015563A9D|nr:S8/S53 family peptidase [Pseudenhygromyxa sp. WMMC2535]NVB37948.1 S8 family serine peptidase [Pseudenhygromyxa sp. WMMC2535]